MLYNKILWFSFCTLLFFAGCKKDPFIPGSGEDQKCDPLPLSPPFGWNYTTRAKNLNVLKSTYDKVNSNIIYYLSDDTTGNAFVLWKLNRLTNSKQLLDTKVFGTPQINNNGWLVYYKSDLNLYIIKNNGDSLTKITSLGGYILPTWDNQNNILSFNNNTSCIIKLNKNGQIIDTLKTITSNVYAKDSLLLYFTASTNSQSLILKNIYTNSLKTIFNNSTPSVYYDFFIDNTNSNVYYSNSEGLYRVDILTNSNSKVITSCPRENLLHFSMSLITGKIMATKITSTVISETTIYNQYDLYDFETANLKPTLISIP